MSLRADRHLRFWGTLCGDHKQLLLTKIIPQITQAAKTCVQVFRGTFCCIVVTLTLSLQNFKYVNHQCSISSLLLSNRNKMSPRLPINTPLGGAPRLESAHTLYSLSDSVGATPTELLRDHRSVFLRIGGSFVPPWGGYPSGAVHINRSVGAEHFVPTPDKPCSVQVAVILASFEFFLSALTLPFCSSPSHFFLPTQFSFFFTVMKWLPNGHYSILHHQPPSRLLRTHGRCRRVFRRIFLNSTVAAQTGCTALSVSLIKAQPEATYRIRTQLGAPYLINPQQVTRGRRALRLQPPTVVILTAFLMGNLCLWHHNRPSRTSLPHMGLRRVVPGLLEEEFIHKQELLPNLYTYLPKPTPICPSIHTNFIREHISMVMASQRPKYTLEEADSQCRACGKYIIFN